VVVRPAIGTGYRWQSRKKEGEENLQERERGGPAVYALPLVRSWVDGNDGGKAGCGGGGRCCCCLLDHFLCSACFNSQVHECAM